MCRWEGGCVNRTLAGLIRFRWKVVQVEEDLTAPGTRESWPLATMRPLGLLSCFRTFVPSMDMSTDSSQAVHRGNVPTGSYFPLGGQQNMISRY